MSGEASRASNKDRHKNFPEDLYRLDLAQNLEGVSTLKVLGQHAEKLRLYDQEEATLENQLFK